MLRLRLSPKEVFFSYLSYVILLQIFEKMVFSDKPFQKKWSKELINASKLGDYNAVLDCLAKNKYIVYDYDHVLK